MSHNRNAYLKKLQAIPGVGPKIANDLFQLGFHKPSELAGQDPEELYRRLCIYQGVQIDRCMLYVFRCAVYFASNPNPEPELLKWWNWQDNK